MVSKVFEKLVHNRIFDHPEKCGYFSDFQYGLRSTQSMADFLTVVYDKIARAFNSSGATRAVALDISQAFVKVWHAGLLQKCVMEFQVRHLALFLLFSLVGSFQWFWMGILHKNIQLILEVLHSLSYTFPTIH